MASKLQLLVVGVGSIGERHVRCFQRTGRVEIAICEINSALREEVAARYSLARSYFDWNTALESDFDAAVLCVPAHLHVPLAIDVLKRHKPVLIEKPLSASLDRIEELRCVAGATSAVTMVAYVLRLHPALFAMRAALQSGRFGRPVQIVGVTGQHFPTYRPAYRDIYYKDRATGGGAIQDALTHLMNAAEWLVGPIDRLAADCAHQILPGVSVEDTVHVMTRQGQVLGSYALNQHQAPNEITVTVACERGTVRYEGHELRWRWMAQPGDPWHDEPCGTLERDDLFVAQAARFLDALAGTAAPSCTLEEAIQTLRVNRAILAAAETACWIDV